jgi:hypothetical protein
MIKQAAIKDDTGKIWTLPRPARHNGILRYMCDSGINGSFLDGQGFILDDNSWVDRKQAAEHALATGQCLKLIAPPDLYSEDLW